MTSPTVIARNALSINTETRVFTNAGAPVNGTSGTFAGVAEKGALLVDTTNALAYQNTNTQASPTWSVFQAASAALTAFLAAIPQTAIPQVTATNATNPANAAYTQDDQTALAALANANKATLNTLLTELHAAGILA